MSNQLLKNKKWKKTKKPAVSRVFQGFYIGWIRGTLIYNNNPPSPTMDTKDLVFTPLYLIENLPGGQLPPALWRWPIDHSVSKKKKEKRKKLSVYFLVLSYLWNIDATMYTHMSTLKTASKSQWESEAGFFLFLKVFLFSGGLLDYVVGVHSRLALSFRGLWMYDECCRDWGGETRRCVFWTIVSWQLSSFGCFTFWGI
jgi:hypothetical protein